MPKVNNLLKAINQSYDGPIIIIPYIYYSAFPDAQSALQIYITHYTHVTVMYCGQCPQKQIQVKCQGHTGFTDAAAAGFELVFPNAHSA